jgi:HAD superfamily hydrolase (TIGR01490 family)
MSTIAFFDVDGTLLKGYSGYYTTLELIRRKVIKKRRLPLAIFYKVISAIYYGDVKKMYEVAIADMAGSHIDYILQIGRETFEKHLKSKIYQEALNEIETHKQKGNKIILLTSGPYMTIKTIEKYVGADDSFSIGPVIENNILQNRLMEPFCYMKGKVQIATSEAKKIGVSLQECFFYADSVHDVHLLSAVGNPHVVNPDRRLRKEALRRGWPVLNWFQVFSPHP